MVTIAFVATSLAVGVSWVFSIRRASLSWQTLVSVLLLIHSILGLHTLLLLQPPNLFSALQIPLNTPTDSIRALLLHRSSSLELNEELEGLLQRLASFEARSLYPRFGHNVLTTCTYCYSFQDFALYAFPRVVLSYLREIAFIGLITSHRRKLGVSTLILMALGEPYLLSTVRIQIPSRGTNTPVIMWHDTLLTVRHIIFVILPLLIHFLPALQFRIPFIYDPPITSNNLPEDTAEVLIQTRQTLTHLLPALHLIRYVQASAMRVPALRARASAWWEEEARVGAWIRGDGESVDEGGISVRSVARGLGVSFDEAREGREEGKLRTNAKVAARALINDGIKVSGHWTPIP